MNSTNLKCIVCNNQLITSEDDRKLYDQNSRNLPRLLDKMFVCLSKFFDLRTSTEWDNIMRFYTKACEIPFCGNCRSLIAQLTILQEHLEPIERKVFKIKSKLSTTIMKIMETHEDDHVMIEAPLGFQQQPGPQMNTTRNHMRNEMMQSSENLESNIMSFRKNIVQRFQPKVFLAKCDQNRNKIRQLNNNDHHKKSSSLSPPPLLLHHDYVAPIEENTQIKMETPPSPLAEAVECHDQDLMNMDFNFEDHQHQQSSTTITVEEPFNSEVEEGIVKMEEAEEPTIKEEIKSDDEAPHNLLVDDIPDDNDPLSVPPGQSAAAAKQKNGASTKKKRKRKKRKHVWTTVKKRNQKGNLLRRKTPIVDPTTLSPPPRKEYDSKKYFPCAICDCVCSRSFNLMRHHMNKHGKTKKQAKNISKEVAQARANKRKKQMEEKLRAKQQLMMERRAKYSFNISQSSPFAKCDPGETLLTYRYWNYKKTQNNVFVCCACGARRIVEGAMTSHITVHHVLTTPDLRYVPRHMNPNYAADLGNGKFLLFDKWEFTRLEDGRFQCSTCLHTGSRRVVSEHIKKIHAPETCRLRCYKCNQGFVSRESLTRHERRHARQRWWKTGYGTFTYDGQYEFDLVDDSYQCGTCGLVNNSIYDITKHIRDVHAEPHNCQCTECGRTFSCRDNLKKHTQSRVCSVKGWRTLYDGKFLYGNKWFVESVPVTGKTVEGVTESVRFRCCTCGQTRGDKISLAGHIREAHINPKSYVCATCGRAFDKLGDLKVHQNCHTTERPFVCEMTHKTIAGRTCGMTFKTKRRLVCHQNMVHFMEQARPKLTSSSSLLTTAATATTTMSVVGATSIPLKRATKKFPLQRLITVPIKRAHATTTTPRPAAITNNTTTYLIVRRLAVDENVVLISD